MSKTFIKVKTSVMGFHNWADCHIEEVKFLRNEHRHNFIITVMFGPLRHDDRDLEFFIMQRELNDIINHSFSFNEHNEVQFGSRSCEMIAQTIADAFAITSDYPVSEIEVSEDGENSAILKIEGEK